MPDQDQNENHDDGPASTPDEPVGSSPESPIAQPESTVGTGSVFAIGCSLFALLFIIIGVAVFIWRQAT